MSYIEESEIKKIAEKFRQDNGNKQIDNNDLLIYMLHKIDCLPCVSHMKMLQDVASQLKMWRWIMPIMLTMIFGLIYFLHS